MKNLALMALLVLLPRLAAAQVYMCVDQHTGKTSFTDRACETAALREEVRVDPTNLDSGQRYAKPPKDKTWRSELDTRKSGADYSAERRGIYENRGTAATQSQR